MPRWDIEAGLARPVAIDVDERARARKLITVDGVEHKLVGQSRRGPFEVRFSIGTRPAALTMRYVDPPLRLGRDSGPVGMAKGIASAVVTFFGLLMGQNVVGPPSIRWTVHELTFDGEGQGSWIVRDDGGKRQWRLSPPGGWLPEPAARDWPPELHSEPEGIPAR
jgi:hypothetical protein